MAASVALELRAMVKLHREILRRLKQLGVKVVDLRIVKGHAHFTLEMPSGAQHRVVGAGSPRDQDGSIDITVQTARRLLRADALQPQKETS